MLVLLILLESLVIFLKSSHSASQEVWSEDTESAHLLPRGIEMSWYTQYEKRRRGWTPRAMR